MEDLAHCQLPDPRPLPYTTPSGAAGLAECLLRTAYASDPKFRSVVPSSPAARLGNACHRILEFAGKGQLASDEATFREAFEEAWTREIATEDAARLAQPAEAHWPAPDRWPNYARRKVATRRLAKAVASARRGGASESSSATDPVVLQESAQEAFHGRLRGRADVIHRGPTHEIEDYKTGALYEADPTGATAVKSHYRVQMLLYAALEHAATGSWPTRATLIPLQGPPALIAIDPDEAAHVAEMSMDALDTYNAAVEADADFQTLASPSAETCVYCPYAIRCPAFWNAASENWRDAGIVAVSGEITHRTESRLSTFNATIAATHGSLPKGEYVLVQLESDRFRELADAPLDSHCAAVGLRSDTVTRQLRSTSRTVTCTA